MLRMGRISPVTSINIQEMLMQEDSIFVAFGQHWVLQKVLSKTHLYSSSTFGDPTCTSKYLR